MSSREHTKRSSNRGSWAICTGNFSALKEILAEKDKPIWVIFQLLDAYLRGFGQVAFSNNPISGLLIITALAVTAPGTLLFAGSTALLGLILAVLLRDTPHHIENGIAVLNPLLLGAISYVVIPRYYGPYDAFSILLLLFGTIVCVYLARAMGTGKSPFTVWPFILTEFTIFLILSAQPNNDLGILGETKPITNMDNATSDATTVDASFIGENATDLDWGMIFHGMVASTSHLLGISNAATGSIIYLAALIFSPITAGFGFLGAVIGTLTGILLGGNLDEIYDGFWGFNCYLTGASLGGNFLVINGHTALATIVAIVFTSSLQFALTALLGKLGMPILALPFVVTATLFIKLRNNPEDRTFILPAEMSFPEKQRRDYLASRRATIAQRIDELEEVGINGGDKQIVDV